jgi:beta-lactamase regulating signal transducer with metallopeptidase domain
MMVSAVVNTLWQGAIVVGLTALALFFVPRRNATTRYAAWFVALLALAVVPAVTTFTRVGAQFFNLIRPHSGGERGVFTFVAVGALVDDATRWFAWQTLAVHWLAVAFAALWFAGSALALSRLVASLARVERIRGNAHALTRIDGVEVLVSDESAIPFAMGILSPAIIVPRELTALGTDLQCAIEHELAHIRRGDVASNAVARLFEGVFFWNPWVRIVGSRLVAEREAACDDRAVRRLGGSSAYARCLADLGRRLCGPAESLLVPSAFSSRHSLVTRIERLMSERSPKELRLNYVAVGGITMLLAAVAIVLQAMLPAPARATALGQYAGRDSTVAAACKNPNAEPQALNAVAPDLPKSEWPTRKVETVVVVKVAADGKPGAVRVYQSSGNAKIDQAVVTAAQHSTYTPRLVNCVPTDGTYLFKAEFAP